MSSPTQRKAAEDLAQFRSQIDAIDAEIIRLLTERSGIVAKVKQLKDAHWPSGCHIRPAREAQMHAAMFSRFKDTLLGAQAGAEIWRLFISAHTMIESKLRIATLPSTSALAQCYFSPLAEYEHTADMHALITSLTQGRTEIACIPYPLDVPALVALLAAMPHARIFGYAPLVLKTTHEPLALFIGNVVPEASGDDVSYFLSGQNVLRVNGYRETHPTDANATFIGAHANPLTLESL